jgi:hypothetical protein
MAGPFDVTASANSHPSKTNLYHGEWREKIYDATKQVLAQNEVVQLINVKKGELVRQVDVEVLVVDANAGNLEVGDGATTNGYLTAINAAALGYTAMPLRLTEGTPNTITGFTTGKHYTVDDTLDLKALGASGITTGKYLVRAFVMFKAADGVS